MTVQDHRHFHRVAHDAPASLSDGGGERPGRILDLSLKGCLLELGAGTDPAPGRDYQIAIHLGAGIDIAMTAELIHREGDRAGFMCKHIDLDSISALRRLVELNLGDPALLDRDLAALATGHEPESAAP